MTQSGGMITKISFQDADGRSVSGQFQVSRGMITVTAVDGRTKTAKIEESMLSPDNTGENVVALTASRGATLTPHRGIAAGPPRN
jgi:hypothetical protein